MPQRLPLAFLAVAAALVAGAFALGPAAQTAVYPLLAFASVGALVVGARRRTGIEARAWAALAVGVALIGAGDLVGAVTHVSSPSAVDALYLAAYSFLMVAFTLLTHRPSIGVAIDAAIVAAGLFVAAWTAFGAFHGSEGHVAHWLAAVATFYPVNGVLAVFFVVRCFRLVGVTPATALAGAGVAALALGDASYALQLVREGSNEHASGGLLWLVAYALWGAAALATGTRAARPVTLPTPGGRATAKRLIVLATVVAGANVALVVGHHDRGSRLVAVVSVGAISLLALARTWELMRGNRRLLEAQHRSEQRFRETLDNVSLVAAGIDTRGVVTYANAYLLALTGWTREEVVGHGWFDRFDDDPDVRREFFECMARGAVRPHFESTIRTRAGELRTIRWSSTIEHGADGSVAGIITIGEDVTERRDAEAELRRREEHFRSLIENASDVVCVLSLDGVSMYESPAVERVLGWRPEELIGRRNFDLNHPDDWERVRASFDAVLRGAQVPPIRCRLRHKDGSWRDVETVANLRERSGEQVLVLNYRDVTERRELEERLLHAQKLEAVGRLAGGVAHDFNNLLTAIGGYAELLVAGLEPGDPRRGDAEEIARAAERAAALTSQLLAFSRRQVLQPEILDAGEVVGGLENLLARLLGSHVELTTRLEPGCRVEADRGQLEQVITNLAVNARDAMPAGGSLTIEVRRVDHDAAFVEIAVTDTGSGMDAETLERLFEPFFTTKEKGKGTGLGLATVHGIVKQSGGDVLVRSAPGTGATFRVLLPLAADAVVVAQAPQASRGGGGAETILLVEDEEMIRRLVRDVLSAAGYAVLDAPAGEPALELMRAHEGAIDLLLTDVVMPGLSGPALAELVVAERPGVRVLFMSGYTSEPEAVVGAADAAFLAKPFAPQDLVAKVREVLEPVAAA